MKIRNGFVSNSSTASFIVTFSASNIVQEDIEQIIKLSEPNRHCFALSVRFADDGTVESMQDEEKEWSNPIEKNMLGFYDIELSTSMFNDWMDVEYWKFVRMLAENKNSRLSLVHIIQTEKEYTSCYEYVTFDNSYDFADKRRQKEIEKEYERYLETLKEEKLI